MIDREWNIELASPAAAPEATEGRTLRLKGAGDELLARSATRGSERAFTAIYERYHQALYAYSRSIVGDDGDAQDVLQSTFAGALAALRRNQRHAPLRPWLFRIAHNEAISVLRNRRRDTGVELTDTAAVGTTVSAADQAEQRARWEQLMSDLGQLPERPRSALLLREMSGLSHQEIAVALGSSPGAAKQAILEARQGLAELAEGRAMVCDDVRTRLSAGDRRALRGRRLGAHLRGCEPCAAFATAIDTRRTDLRAFAPVLAPAVAAALLHGSITAATGHAAAVAGSSASTSVLASGTAGAAGKAGALVAWKTIVASKTLAVLAVLVAGSAGTAVLVHVLGHRSVAHRPHRGVQTATRPPPAAAPKRQHHVFGAPSAGSKSPNKPHRSRSGSQRSSAQPQPSSARSQPTTRRAGNHSSGTNHHAQTATRSHQQRSASGLTYTRQQASSSHRARTSKPRGSDRFKLPAPQRPIAAASPPPPQSQSQSSPAAFVAKCYVFRAMLEHSEHRLTRRDWYMLWTFWWVHCNGARFPGTPPLKRTP